MKQILYMIGLLLIVAVFAQCNKKRTPETCKEVVNPDCNCPAVYDPVCGCNNVTYGNSCEAQCHGITDYTKGACQ